MKTLTGNEEIHELYQKIRPEYEKLVQKFNEEVKKGGYLEKIVNQELSENEDLISDGTDGFGLGDNRDFDMESEDGNINLTLRLSVKIDIIDNNFDKEGF